MPSLRSLVTHPAIDVVLVVTQPDRPAGRGRQLTPPPVKLSSQELAVPVYQPDSLRTEQGALPIQEAAPDLLVVVAYGEILRRHVLELAPHGAINVHPSLLPRYRGSSPVRAAILNGDETTGVSIIKLIRKLDAGPIIYQQQVDIADRENAGELELRLAGVAAGLLPSACLEWIGGSIEPRDQDESRASMTREWTRDDARIDWARDATDIERLVRASQPWPVAWTVLEGEPFRIHQVRVSQPTELAPGSVRRVGKQVLAGCGAGAIILEKVQPAGKRAISALDWWNGVRSDEVLFSSETIQS